MNASCELYLRFRDADDATLCPPIFGLVLKKRIGRAIVMPSFIT